MQDVSIRPKENKNLKKDLNSTFTHSPAQTFWVMAKNKNKSPSITKHVLDGDGNEEEMARRMAVESSRWPVSQLAKRASQHPSFGVDLDLPELDAHQQTMLGLHDVAKVTLCFLIFRLFYFILLRWCSLKHLFSWIRAFLIDIFTKAHKNKSTSHGK